MIILNYQGSCPGYGFATAFFCFTFSSVLFIAFHLSPYSISSSFSFLPPLQAQLIHDRNTASHATINDKAEGGLDRVHMTWTKEKLFTERNRNRESNSNVVVRDLFNMKP